MKPAIRPGRPEDIAALTTIMARAVRETGSAYYTEIEVNAWWSACTEQVIRRNAAGGELWVVDDGGPVAFMVIHGSLVDLLYTDPDHGRKGHAGALLRHAQTRRPHLKTEASLVSRPVFAQAGFREDGPVTRDLAGVPFTNTRMIWP